MLSAFIRTERGYPAMGEIHPTGTPEVRPSRSSRTRDRPTQIFAPTAD